MSIDSASKTAWGTARNFIAIFISFLFSGLILGPANEPRRTKSLNFAPHNHITYKTAFITGSVAPDDNQENQSLNKSDEKKTFLWKF